MSTDEKKAVAGSSAGEEERLERSSSGYSHTIAAPADPSPATPDYNKRTASSSSSSKPKRADGKVELTDEDAPEVLGFAWPEYKKWSILSVIFVVQVSLNFNSAVYPNAVPLIADYFHVSEQAARVGQMIFLVAYAFGSELWAPWSEELGRWPILQLSLLLVNFWQLPGAFAQNLGTIIVGRFFGGICSAGGSVTLGMVADMWDTPDQQFPVAFVVLSSVFGSSISPVIGGFMQAYLDFRWNFWIQLIFGGATQILHFFAVPETRSTVLLDREAKRRRNLPESDPQYDPNIYGPNELKENRFTVHEILTTWARPFEMFAREPIVLFLSLLSGFSDALIFTFLDSFSFVFQQWGFDTVQIGLSFIPINLGYFLAYASFIWPILKQNRIRRSKGPDAVSPEARLWWLLFLAPLEPIGLFGFAWTSLGPKLGIPWIAPMIFSTLIAIANYAIYMATIDYMVAAYGPYSASATGGNALARDFLAGVAAMYSVPLYEKIGVPHNLEWASTILACIAVLVIIPVYVIYVKGPDIRANSKFAQTLASEKMIKREHTRQHPHVHRGGAHAPSMVEKVDRSVADIEHSKV